MQSVINDLTKEQQVDTTSETIDFSVDPEAVDNRSGNFLFTVGNVSSGKSTLQNVLVYKLYTDNRTQLEYANIDGDAGHDVILDNWVQNLKKGYLPHRSQAGRFQEFNVKFRGKKRRALDFSFIEISGEDIRTIRPTVESVQEGLPPKLHDTLDKYLRLPQANKRFIFVSDASKNRKHGNPTPFDEDMLFTALIGHLLSNTGIRLNRIDTLFAAAKWDIVENEYRSEKEYFAVNFPATTKAVKATSRINACYMPFSIGKVEESEENGEVIAKVNGVHDQYVEVLISWLYYTFTGRELQGFPKVRQNLWDRIKALAAR